MPPHIFPIRSLGPREWLQDFLSEWMQRCSLPSRPKEKKKQLEIHLHNCSLRLWHWDGQLQQVLAMASQAVLLYTAPERTEAESKQGRRCARGSCHHKQWAIEGIKNTLEQYSVLCLTWSWSSCNQQMLAISWKVQQEIEHSPWQTEWESQDILSKISLASWQEVLMLAQDCWLVGM